MPIDTWPWSHTCWGHMVLTGPQVCKWVKFYIFRLSYKLTSHDLWPSFVTFDLTNMWRFLHYINKLSLVPVGLQLFKWGESWAHLTTWPLMTFDLGIWPLTTWTYKGSHNVSINPVWFQSDFTFQMKPLSHFQPILQLDLRWPLTLYVNFDLINIWGFPCCIYDPTLVEIHQRMRKLEPNVNLFSQTTTGDKVIPMCISC